MKEGVNIEISADERSVPVVEFSNLSIIFVLIGIRDRLPDK
jgi:hypothetical protein